MPTANELTPNAPYGTIRAGSLPGVYHFRGTEGWHQVNLKRSSCSCEDFRNRRSARSAWCKHLRRVADSLASLEPRRSGLTETERREIFK